MTTFAARTVRTRKMLRRTSGSAERRSITTNATSSAMASGEEAAGVQRDPALLLRLDDPVDERQQPGRDGDRARDVEALVRVLVLRLGDEPHRRDEDGDPDGHVDEEDPRPRERGREHAAEDETDGASTDGDRGPHAHRLRPLRALLERRRDDRQRGRRDERGSETLEPAEEDERLRARREPVEERCDREDHDADEEDALAPDEVACAPAEEQEAAERERVRVDDPLQVGVRHLQVFLDRRQRDVHDRRVEDHHELRHADEHEHEPRVDAVVVRRSARGGELAHEPRTLAMRR